MQSYAPYPTTPPISRYTARTPSPTPSEVEALSSTFASFKKYLNWRFWARKDWILYYVIGSLILIAAILISVFDKQIVQWLTPAGKWMRSLKAGWLIPIGVLFVISFPPLFGHEIVAILVGVIWGLGIGFAIVAAGTFLGEVGNFYAFKYCCRARGEKMEKGSITYACLAQAVRDGGFKVALIIRLSVIPGHFSTAVFSTCGMGILVFGLAAFLSLPKQLITVYLGVILEESGAGTSTKKDKIISDSVLAVTILITAAAMWYVWREINLAKPSVIYARRKARQVKMANPAYGFDNSSATNLYPTDSDVQLPLSVIPQRPVNFDLNNQSRETYAGHGGYVPSFMQGRYGEALDEQKSTGAVGWETRGPRVEDMRGAKWGVVQDNHDDDDDESEESAHTVVASTSTYHSPPGQILYDPPLDKGIALSPPPASLPNPFDDPSHRSPLHQHKFQLSDPPVTGNHSPYPSDSTYDYPSSLNPPSRHAQTDVPVEIGHSQEPSYASSYNSQDYLEPQRGHSLHPTDASDSSYYTASGAHSREPSSEEAPQLGPVRTFSPLVKDT